MEVTINVLSISSYVMLIMILTKNEGKGARIELKSSLFSDVAKSDAFVDKTLFIEECFKELKSFVITAPRGFGKSTNLNMLKTFLSISVDNERGEVKERSETHSYRLFVDNKLAIYEQETALFMTYFGEYPVIEVDFKTTVSVRNFNDAFEICKRKIHDSFKQHVYLIKSEHLNDEERKMCNLWCGDDSFNSVNVNDLQWSLYNLSRYLNKHFKKKVYVLVDDYDSIVTDAIFNINNDYSLLNNTVNLIVGVLINVLKDNPHIELGVLTGVTNVVEILMSREIDLWVYTFLAHHPFCDYYGFTSYEADRLFNKTKFNLNVNSVAEARARYGGYVSKWGKRIYNPYSVLRFLNSGGKVDDYWSISGRTEADRFIRDGIFKIPDFRNCISQMLRDEAVTVDFVEYIPLKNITSAKRILSGEKIESPTDIDLYFAFLLQHGYLSFGESDDQVDVIKIPNREVKRVFARKLSDYYGAVYSMPSELANRCAGFFHKVSPSAQYKDKEVRHQLKEFQHCLTRLFLSIFGENHLTLNDTILHHVIYSLLWRTEFFTEFNITTKIKYENGTIRMNRVDFLLFKGDFGIIIKIEYRGNRKPFATDAVREMLGKEYYRVFQDVKHCPLLIKNYFLIGLSVSSVGHVTISCLTNSKNIEEAVLLSDAVV